MKYILITAAAGALLYSFQAQAGPPLRTERLAERNYGQHGHDQHHNDRYDNRYDNRHDNRHDNRYDNRYDNRHRPSSGHRGTDYAQHRYDNARRYAANAVRQAREAQRLGFYPDHPRWSANFQNHFEWALHADAWKIEREARKRALQLRELRQRARYGYAH